MRRFLMISAAVFAFASSAYADSHQALGIQGDDLYSFATSASQKNGVVGGEIENITGGEISVVRAESDVAERVELHTHIMEGGVMMMREVESYKVGANDGFELGPRAEHIMLMGLNTPLKQGDVFSVRLFDEKGASIEVPVLVRAPGDIPEDDDGSAHKGHKEGHQHHGHEH